MSKALKRITHILVLPCLCAIVFYMGSQIVTYTEAAFSKQQTVTSTLSAAIVFPETIEELVGKAEEHSKMIFQYYDEIQGTSNANETVAEMEEKLAVWKQKREAVQEELTALHTVYTEIESYYNRAVEDAKKSDEPSANDVLTYVQAGFEKVQHINSSVNGEAVSKAIDAQIAALEKEIEEEKKKLLEQAQQDERGQENLEQTEEPKQIEEPMQTEEPKQIEEPKKIEEPKQTEEVKQPGQQEESQ